MLSTKLASSTPEAKSCIKEKNMTTAKTIVGWKEKFYPDWREFACGCGAAIVNITITYPVNKLIFRQMLHGVNAHNAFKELHHEGIHYLYRGILPPLMQKSLSLSLMFGIYEEVRRSLSHAHVNNFVSRIVAGLVAGSAEAILTPFERIQTLLADSTYHNRFRNTYDAFRVIGTTYGVREYYRGLHVILLRNGPANVCFFILREETQCLIPKSSTGLSRNMFQFFCGALIGACVSCFFYPLNVVKVTLQSKIGGNFESISTVLPRIYYERGSKLRYVYRGVQVNCTRSFISWGIMNVAYENIKKWIY